MKKLAAICLGVVIGLLSFVMVPAQDMPQVIKGGILNGKAVSLPAPEYPAEAKAIGWEGTVVVDVTIDESGTVISAATSSVVKTPTDGEPEQKDGARSDSLLRAAAQRAALEARFSPTSLNGVPVKVSGAIVYNFVSGDSVGSPVNGGIINGKATTLPKPVYPEAAKAVRAGGNVVIRVIIDVNGDVIAATAISGHPLLRAASVEAAKGAKFSPTLLSGQPVKVAGILTYNFIPPKKEETN